MRTHSKYCRAFIDGVDVSGYTRSVGSLDWTFDAEPDAAFTDGVKNILVGKGNIAAGGYSAFLDNDAAGLFSLASAVGTRNYMVAIGANAAPVQGNPVFAWQFEQSAYSAEQGTGFVAVTVPFGGASYASALTYKKPWGFLLHPAGLEEDINSAIGVDDNSGASALGGLFIYHLLSSDGTVTLFAEDAATNTDPSFAPLVNATSGEIDASVSPKSGIIALATDADVRRYTRWQIEFGTATGATFVCALIRNNLP